MNKYKNIILVLFLFIITGCSVDYNLEISEDLSLSENVVAKENTITMQTNTNLVGEDAVNYLYEMFAPDGIEFSSTSDETNTIATSNRTFSSFEDYKENFYSDVFDDAKVSKSNNIYTLSIDQLTKLGNSGSNSPIYDEINVNITIPFRVTENNADEVNGNVYTWKIVKNKLKNIKVSFDKGDPITSSSIVIGDKVYNSKVIYSLIIIGAFAIFSLVLYIIVRNNKNNSL